MSGQRQRSSSILIGNLCSERTLRGSDLRSAARLASCGQAIASDSAFSLGMLAVFDESLRDEPWSYPRLFWECGLVGQTLYMEAEAAGLRGTGIGCYFDDLVHDLVGLGDTSLRDLYHFAVGGAVDDPRLTTLPVYPEPVKPATVAPADAAGYAQRPTAGGLRHACREPAGRPRP